jgi:arylsulfatase A-like enzyme
MTNHTKPNLVLILVDDMGYGDFSAFNGGCSHTPRLDELIGESLCLTQHYTASPVCNPSRAALLTGRYPHRTGSIDTLEWRGLERLALSEVTLADMFQKDGYATGLVGKWHLGAFDPRYHPNRRGFQEAVCFRGGMHDYFNWRLEYNETVKRADGRYLTDLWADEAIAFIQRHIHDPFFLHVTFNAPHTPLEAPWEEIQPFLETGKFNRGVSILYGMIQRMDKAVARILESLRENGLEENTIVLFSSDNGPQFGGEGQHDLTRFNCQFNGAKGSVYEGGIRVPAILRWPAGGFTGGRRYDAMVHFTDWFPTLLAMSGLDTPQGIHIDGLNVLPDLLGVNKSTLPPRFWQWNRYTPLVTCNAAVRDGPWKLIRPWQPEAGIVPDLHWLWVSMYGPEYFIENGILTEPDPPRQVSPPANPELYNLADDPLEQHNLAAQHPDQVSRLLRLLENWFEEVESDRRKIKDR